MSELFVPGPGSIPVKGSAKALLTLFIVDTSGSMSVNGRIEKVNDAFEQIVQGLKERQNDVGDSFTIYISILGFNQTAYWICEPTAIADYYHQAISCSNRVTFFGEAMKEVDQKLSRSEFLSAFKNKIAAPYIMFMTDGYPTQEDNYDEVMDSLSQNGWFKQSKRYAVLIGDDATHNPDARKAVARFVSKDDDESIISADDAEEIARKVTASTLIVIDKMTRHGIPGESQPGETGSTGSTSGTGNDVPDWGDVFNPANGSDSSATDEDIFKNLFPGLSNNS